MQPAPEPTKTAVVYARVSTNEQAERDGEPDGYSIPAQRDAGRRKAESLSATVVEVYVDRGESARSADRPALQRMLQRLAADPVDYVIVHKLDRLARNRSDDVAITAAIAATGAQLVSVTENIDETPGGILLHGIMSSIAEFYSRNLAAEVLKGTLEKVRAGGTPGQAPIGYRNVRRMVGGYETRTVEVDTERELLVAWAFTAYATGAWSLNSLAEELERRGLTFRATAKLPERPVTAKRLHGVLRNRYYLGIVTWRAVEYEGKHPRLIDADTFHAVQRVLEEHRLSGERPSKHDHYLTGSLRCSRCGRKLLYTQTRGRRGQSYAYFYCASRLDEAVGCGLRYLPAALVERAVEQQWLAERVAETDIGELAVGLAADLTLFRQNSQTELSRLQKQLHKIKRERFKWAEKAMSGAVPDDIARDKQRQLAGQLLTAEAQLARHGRVESEHETALAALLDLITRAGDTYQSVDSAVRRTFNQAWFDWLWIDEDQEGIRVSRGQRTELTQAVATAERGRTADTRHDDYQVVAHVRGSNVAVLVEPRGFEPLTPALQRRCSAVELRPRVGASAGRPGQSPPSTARARHGARRSGG
jgi:site-specific DNA recombinase